MSQPPFGQHPPYGAPQRPPQQWGVPQWGQRPAVPTHSQYSGFGNPHRPPQQPGQGQRAYPGQFQQGAQQNPYQQGSQYGQPAWQGQPGWQGQPAWQPPQKRRSGSPLWIALPLVVLGLMIGYFVLSSDSSPVTPNPGENAEYVNEEYNVPGVGEGPSQVVDTYDDPTALTENGLYTQEVAIPVRCEAAALDDVRDEVQLQARMTDLSDCLTRAFGPALEAAGFQAYQPRVLVFEGSGSSPCGELEGPGAFFCGGNQMIYISSDLARISGNSVAALDYVMAHEYGHNVQGRTGILVQRVYEEQSSYSEAEQLEVNRRLETQADCLAGTFMSSAAQSLEYTDGDISDVITAARSVGDDQLLPPEELPSGHGVSDSRQLWVERGLAAETFESCNTFVAPASEVE